MQSGKVALQIEVEDTNKNPEAEGLKSMIQIKIQRQRG